MRPSEQMEKVISGLIRPEDCDEAVRSWLRHRVYLDAVRILSLPFDKRAQEIEKHNLSDMVKEEVVRVHALRNNKATNQGAVGKRSRV